MTTPEIEAVAKAIEVSYDSFPEGTPLRDMWPVMAKAATKAIRPMIEAAYLDGAMATHCQYGDETRYATRIIANATGESE